MNLIKLAHRHLKKNLPNRSLLVATGLARLSTMESAARLKLGMVEDYR